MSCISWCRSVLFSALIWLSAFWSNKFILLQLIAILSSWKCKTIFINVSRLSHIPDYTGPIGSNSLINWFGIHRLNNGNINFDWFHWEFSLFIRNKFKLRRIIVLFVGCSSCSPITIHHLMYEQFHNKCLRLHTWFKFYFLDSKIH